MSQLNILFKIKGGHKEGIGDVTSSLALAEEFRARGHAVVFIINNNQIVANLISQRDFGYRIAESSIEVEESINRQSIDIAILNQLNTVKDEALIFRRHSKVLVSIDDTGSSARLSDLRFNVLYPIADSIIDFKYIALSSIFQQKHNIPKRIRERIGRILVTQGGSDTYGYTPKIMRALYNIPNTIHVDVIFGPSFSHYPEVDKILHRAPRDFNIITRRGDLSDLMLEADLAISAAGITLFELACLGIPTIVVCGELFEVETAKRLQREGFGINLGFGGHVDEDDIYTTVRQLMHDFNLRSEMNKKGKGLIDGCGIQRMAEIIVESFYRKYNAYSKST